MTFLLERILHLSEHLFSIACVRLFKIGSVLTLVGISKQARAIVMQDLPKERSKKWCKNLKLHFATTLNHQFHFKLGIKPSQAAYVQSHNYANFLVKCASEKNLASKFPLIPQGAHNLAEQGERKLRNENNEQVTFVSSCRLFLYLTLFYWENRCSQILRNTVALNQCVALSARCKNFFGLYKI